METNGQHNYTKRIITGTNNPLLIDFAYILYKHNKPLNMVLSFFKYWDNFDNRSGIWVLNKTTFIYDDNVLFNEDTLLTQYGLYVDCIHES